MRIIVVEDDDGVAEALVDTLTDVGWEAARFARGDDGLRHVGGADLVLLDLGLPDMDGLEFLRLLRRASEVPVLVLTARDSDGAVVLGLRAGADDYLVKPVRAPVLVARVQALARRARVATPAPGTAGAVGWGGLRIDPAARTVTLQGSPVDLTATELDVLLVLAERPGEAVSRETLHLRVWGSPDAGRSRSLDFFIAALRGKLGPDLPLTTVRGFGYRLEA